MLALVYTTVISLVPTPAPQTTSSGCSRRAALATGLATTLAALPAPSLASNEDQAGNFMKEVQHYVHYVAGGTFNGEAISKK